MSEDVEKLKAEIQRMIGDSLSSPFIGRKLTQEDADSAAALYKRQIERLVGLEEGVTVKAVIDPQDPWIIHVEARWPVREWVEVSFIVEENKNG